MSSQYREAESVPNNVLAERLLELSVAVAQQNWGEFTMRVPAELDRDADLVLQEVAWRLCPEYRPAHLPTTAEQSE